MDGKQIVEHHLEWFRIHSEVVMSQIEWMQRRKTGELRASLLEIVLRNSDRLRVHRMQARIVNVACALFVAHLAARFLGMPVEGYDVLAVATLAAAALFEFLVLPAGRASMHGHLRARALEALARLEEARPGDFHAVAAVERMRDGILAESTPSGLEVRHRTWRPHGMTVDADLTGSFHRVVVG